MPHDGQLLPLAVRRSATTLLLLSLGGLGCARSGDVVVVIDSTLRGEALEVVAIPLAATGEPIASTPTSRTGDSIALLRGLEDSTATLDSRFRTLRDSLASEVRALDTADRTTRAYAARYAGIRRRTVGAEGVRSTRDSLRARAAALRSALGPRVSIAALPGSSGRAIPADPGGRRTARRRMEGDMVTLSLAPGRWLIGMARSGAEPASRESVTVRAGKTDTLRFDSPRARRP
jgi:hypothetical protein